MANKKILILEEGLLTQEERNRLRKDLEGFNEEYSIFTITKNEEYQKIKGYSEKLKGLSMIIIGKTGTRLSLDMGEMMDLWNDSEILWIDYYPGNDEMKYQKYLDLLNGKIQRTQTKGKSNELYLPEPHLQLA